MRKVYNIRLKDEPDARIKAIKKFKDAFSLPLIGAKDRVEKLLAEGILVTESQYYDMFSWESAWWVEHHLRDIFDCEFENADERPSNENIREPDEATKKALAWRDSLSEDEQEMIKLIADWENPVCFAAVC